jgi:DNA-binding NarL/FixJ family response regulator
VAKAAAKPEIAICLVSPHPLVLDELKAAFPKNGFRLGTLQIDERPNAEMPASFPAATVYAVDGQGGGKMIERLAATLLKAQTGSSVLILESEFAEEAAFPLLRAGVKGLLRYAEAREQLPRAVQALAGGGYWVPRALLAKFVDVLLKGGGGPVGPPAELSPRERQVMDALLENLSNKEIASQLNISERTVKFHVSSILGKYKVQRRADLILRFYQDNPS